MRLTAEYRYSIRGECPLPPRVVNQLPDRLWDLYQDERFLNRTWPNLRPVHFPEDDEQGVDDEGTFVPETAFVEYSYFIASRSTNDNVWVGDSGASCHMTCSLDGMHNLRETYSQVQIGTGETIDCNKIGDKHVTILQLDGSTHDIELKNCKYVPGLFTNLFSITKALEQDWRLSNEGLVLTISKMVFLSNLIKFYARILVLLLRLKCYHVRSLPMLHYLIGNPSILISSIYYWDTHVRILYFTRQSIMDMTYLVI